MIKFLVCVGLIILVTSNEKTTAAKETSVKGPEQKVGRHDNREAACETCMGSCPEDHNYCLDKRCWSHECEGAPDTVLGPWCWIVSETKPTDLEEVKSCGPEPVTVGKPRIVTSGHCRMDGDWYVAERGASCLLGNGDEPISVDYTAAQYTKYSFQMRMFPLDANRNTLHPHGGFKVCNLDGSSGSRGRSPEFWFIDRGGDWGWGLYNGGFGHAAFYKDKKNTALDPTNKANGQKHEITMRWDGSNYFVENWCVDGMCMPAYKGRRTGCDGNPANYKFTPRIWTYTHPTKISIKDFKVFQSGDNSNWDPILGTALSAETEVGNSLNVVGKWNTNAIFGFTFVSFGVYSIYLYLRKYIFTDITSQPLLLEKVTELNTI